MSIPVDPHLLHAIEEAEANALAARCWSLTGLYLCFCQRCGDFTGRDCPDFPGPKLLDLLLDRNRQCPRWVEIHERTSNSS